MRTNLPNHSNIKMSISVEDLRAKLPITKHLDAFVTANRTQISASLSGTSDKLIVITGPCSVHDVDACLDYAQLLSKLQKQHQKNLCIVMRTYLEKPRTIFGWKGFINDPYLDESFEFNHGISQARQLLVNINNLGLGCATEVLNPALHQYYIDLISWASIGARTTESQPHRELASGLPCPVGFKNTTEGNVQAAIHGALSAQVPHVIHGYSSANGMASVQTHGNRDSHVVLRGGKKPNYHMLHVNNVASRMQAHNLKTGIVIDFSHGNSNKEHENQKKVAHEISNQIASGNQHISGVMLESFLRSGKQSITHDKPLLYGQSITDACLNFADTEHIIAQLSTAVEARREQSKSTANIDQIINA